ncbi:MAG: hypothetical protein CMJ83_01500 [Planctomycetes bacterium]|nr:hypothetical protein [Planctomycetota bacterium]
MGTPKLVLGLFLILALGLVATWTLGDSATQDDQESERSRKVRGGSDDGAPVPGDELTLSPETARGYGVARSSFIPADWNAERPEKQDVQLDWRERKLMNKFKSGGLERIGNSSVFLSPNMKPTKQGARAKTPKTPKTRRPGK